MRKELGRFNHKGFTLLEIMVAVAIIGVLAAIAVPSYRKYTYKAKQVEGKATLSSAYTGMKLYFSDYYRYTTRLDAIGYKPEGIQKYVVAFNNDLAGVTSSPGWPGCNATANYTGGVFTNAKDPECVASTLNPQWDDDYSLDPNTTRFTPPASFAANTATNSTFNMAIMSNLKLSGTTNSSDVDSWSINNQGTIRSGPQTWMN
jgi:prepilin-type N-terminal cleavage/methylation domain-containing protein